ncbi:uncharacterized protein LOC133333037 [Musca vetustissima]|uniref:uncharacterized protein LOC133333037 n=1 Tax=Musca vetustissima TaxID=27455 RepID=UPI002AB6DD9B|nr:uncharacterized protein LOC133333037 [Musca vetustissima]
MMSSSVKVLASNIEAQENASAASSQIPSRKKYPAPPRPSIQELKQKYESQSTTNGIVNSSASKILKPKSPKMRSKSMVKQMASMFNNKISQIIRRDTEVTSSSSTTSTKKPTESLPKPLPMPRFRHNKEKAPVPSPRTKSKSRLQRKPSYFVAEDAFAHLSVKDKAMLYTQFVEDMSKKNPRFGRHAGLIEATVKKEVARGEVINERQESVKQLRQQLEARCSAGQSYQKEKMKPKFIATTLRPSRKCSVKAMELEDLKSVRNHQLRRARSLSHSKIDQLIVKNGVQTKEEASISFATPKQIRASRCEVMTPQLCLANRQLETLFYSWLKEKHSQHEETQQSNTCEMEDERQKSAIDRLLEEAIVKLENPKKRPAPAVPQPTKAMENSEGTSSSLGSSLVSSVSSSSAKQSSSGEESESGISNLTKNTSDEEQKVAEKMPSPAMKETDRPVKPLRKKKMRRTLSWKKDSCLVETKPISSTDSENETKNERPIVHKRPSCQITKQQPQSSVAIETQPSQEASFGELDKSLMRVVNSPRKIKSAYTLTVFSPPPSRNQSLYDMDSDLPKSSEVRPATDLSFDQGFETGSNDLDSPIKVQRKPILRRQSSIERSQKIPENPSGFSTPIKRKTQEANFNQSAVGQQQLFSPISVPMKNRRRSIYDNESRRSSIAMQVIREDHPLEHHEMKSPRNLCNTEVFFANAPTLDMTSCGDLTGITSPKSSLFWIKSSDFNLSFDIHKNEKERLKLLHEIFSQRSCDTKEMHFGIDKQRFSVHNQTQQGDEEEALRLPQTPEVSQYWFSTGDLVIPFAGKQLSEEKIQKLFQVIKSTVEENGILRFGVDDVEFSNVPENWTQSPKFSMESNYSMLVGLQSGNSNGLEGRSKYAWPNTKPVPVSDLDQSDYEEDQEVFAENDSYSPFSGITADNKHFDLACLDNGVEEEEILDLPRSDEALLMSEESFCLAYENEPLDQLFEHKIAEETQHPKESSLNDSKLPEILTTLQGHQELLTSVQERMSGYQNPLNLSCDSLEELKGTPEYLAKIKSIVSDISRIGSRNGFKDCSLEDLERYMFFLSRYADICLNSCSSQMDKILDAMMERSRTVEM